MHYKDSTGFTYLTQTFLFCTCIPALHDCSGCGLKDFGCWQPTKCMIFLFFFFNCCTLSTRRQDDIENVAHVLK